MKGIDIEATNRCNANCHFCPRDATPHQGLMTMETYEHSLAHSVMMRDTLDRPIERISLCGLGEPLLNRQLPEMIRMARREGFYTRVASNGGLLDERRRAALLEAELDEISLNIGETGDAYQEIYEIPWETTLERVTAFIKEAQGICEVEICLVDHRHDPEHMERLHKFWRDLGVTNFIHFEMGNRGGALEVDDMDFLHFPEQRDAEAILSQLPERPICGVPFLDWIIGYDGYLYLCCQDWKKEAPVGHVSDPDIEDIVRKKIEFVQGRAVVCKTCKLEPTNRLVTLLREVKAGEAEESTVGEFVDRLQFRSAIAYANATDLAPDLDIDAIKAAHPNRKQIPVRAL